MTAYSHSKLSTYENCPQQYKLRYIDGIEVPEAGEGIEAFLGLRVHEVLEKLHKELILSRLNSLEDILSYYRTQWERNWHGNVLILREGFTKNDYWKAGEEAIAGYYRRYHPFNQSKTLATEHPITFDLEGYTIRGYIDRLSHDGRGGYEIHDYKTSGWLPTQDQVDRDRQLGLYHMGITEKFGDVRAVRLVWHYLLFDKEFVSERTEAQLKDLKAQVVSLIRTIERDSTFEPKESKLCDWCEYPEYCPAKMHEAEVGKLPPNKYLKEKGVTLVNQYAALSARIKELKETQIELEAERETIAEAAVAYAEQRGLTKIAGSDFYLKVAEQMVLEFPRAGEDGREALENYLKETGGWEKVSILNAKKVSKAIDDGLFDQKTVKTLRKFGEEVSKTSVRLVKKHDEEE